MIILGEALEQVDALFQHLVPAFAYRVIQWIVFVLRPSLDRLRSLVD